MTPLFFPLRILLLALLCSLCLVLPTLAHASPKRFQIESMSLVTENAHLGVRLALTVDDEDALYNLLKNGAHLGLRLTASLERERSWWGNAELASVEQTYHLQHSPLTREFVFTAPGDAPVLKNRNMGKLLAESWKQLHLPLVPMTTIDEQGLDKSYKVIVEVALIFLEAPPWLASSSIFWTEEVVPPVSFSLVYRYQ